MLEYINTQPAYQVIGAGEISRMHDLFVRYFEARYDVFTVELGWFARDESRVEQDQYDLWTTKHLVVFIDGEVAAGMRLLPTTNRCGAYSYMIRDAQCGMLPTLPTDLLFEEAPVAENVWECTRLFITEPYRKRRELRDLLALRMVATARQLGVETLLAMTPATWPRWYKPLGVAATAAGPVFKTPEGMRSQCVAIDIGKSCTSQLH